MDEFEQFVSLLAQETVGTEAFNPWQDTCSMDLSDKAPEDRRVRLLAHLSVKKPGVILIGEAPGFRGCRFSGIPFTSEWLLLENRIPRLGALKCRLTRRQTPFREPSATIVWDQLRLLGVEETAVLWNAYPFHPHKPGNSLSNRTPRAAEFEMYLHILEQFLALYPGATVAAVGKKSARWVAELGVDFVGLRHPSFGGKVEFSQQLAELVGSLHLDQ